MNKTTKEEGTSSVFRNIFQENSFQNDFQNPEGRNSRNLHSYHSSVRGFQIVTVRSVLDLTKEKQFSSDLASFQSMYFQKIGNY